MSENLKAYDKYKAMEEELADLTAKLAAAKEHKKKWEPQLQTNLEALNRLKAESESGAGQAKHDSNKARISEINAEAARYDAEIKELGRAKSREEIDKEIEAYEAEVGLISKAVSVYLEHWAHTLETAERRLTELREELIQQRPADLPPIQEPKPGSWQESPLMKTWNDIFGEEVLERARRLAPGAERAADNSEAQDSA